MNDAPHPFAVPATLHPDVRKAMDYWNGLKRGENEIPFSDDVNLSNLGGLEARSILVDVFDKPQRFRFAIVGSEVARWCRAEIAGRFVDEIGRHDPLAYIGAQASATVEAAVPTYHRNGFARLLLPLWGNGQIAMLLGVIVTA